jgi:hypothetical protein
MKEMNTAELFALLQAAYPQKSWHLEPYIAKGTQHHAIHLSHEGFGIHNPFESECSRFEKTDRYGLSEEHARLMRRHNSHFVTYVLGSSQDLLQVFDCVVDAVQNKPSLAPAAFLDDFGFARYDTGGGCVGYALFNPDGTYLYVTDRSGQALPKVMSEAWVGLYNADMQEIKCYFPND